MRGECVEKKTIIDRDDDGDNTTAMTATDHSRDTRPTKKRKPSTPTKYQTTSHHVINRRNPSEPRRTLDGGRGELLRATSASQDGPRFRWADDDTKALHKLPHGGVVVAA